MTRQRKEEIRKSFQAWNIKIIPGKRKYREPSDFEKKKQADAIAFLKKNGLPKDLQDKIDLDSL